MSVSAIYILDKKGNILISRNYKLEVQENVVDTFIRKQMELTPKTYTPFLIDEENEIVFTFHNHKNITIVLISDQNEDTLILVEFLKGFLALLQNYLKEVEEESVKDNFIIIYELLDEVIDNGYVQCVDVNFLKDYIKTDYHELIKPDHSRNSSFIRGPQLNKKITWRNEGIKYSQNEFYMDIYEHISFTCDVQGNVSKSEIKGVVKANSKLSGMPRVEMGLNEKNSMENLGLDGSMGIEFNHTQFHQCVNLFEYQNNSKIIFTPPDGEFELMTYFIKTNVKPLFSIVLDQIKSTKSSAGFVLTLTSNYKSKSIANNVVVKIPTPCDANQVEVKSKDGNALYEPKNDTIEWTIPNMKGENLCLIEFNYKLPSLISPNREDYKNEPLKIDFQIPYFTMSGLNVRYMKIVDESGYEGTPWVRYVTVSDEYNIRK